jgi:hypothetical protein
MHIAQLTSGLLSFKSTVRTKEDVGTTVIKFFFIQLPAICVQNGRKSNQIHKPRCALHANKKKKTTKMKKKNFDSHREFQTKAQSGYTSRNNPLEMNPSDRSIKGCLHYPSLPSGLTHDHPPGSRGQKSFAILKVKRTDC